MRLNPECWLNSAWLLLDWQFLILEYAVSLRLSEITYDFIWVSTLRPTDDS